MPPSGTQVAQLYVGVGALGGRETVAEIMRLSGLIDKVDGQSASVSVDAETGIATRMVDEISNKAKVLDNIDPQVSVSAAGGPSMAILDELKARAMLLDNSDPHITVSADIRAAAMMIDELRNKVSILEQQAAHISIGGGMGGMGGGKLGMMSNAAQMAMMMKTGGGGFGGVAMTGLGGAQMLSGMGMSATVTGVGAGLVAGGALAVGSVMKAGEMERYQTQLEVFLGSAEKAKARIAELAEFGAKTPFELPEVVQASKMLQVFAGDVLSTGDGLRMIGDVAAGTQNGFSEVAMWFGRMYDAMKSGRPFGEATMRLQEMGAISGESREKIEGLAEKVKSGSMTMEEAWKSASGEFGRFGGMMEKQSGTFEGKMSNLSDAVGMGLAKIGEKLLPVAKDLLDVAIPAMSALADGIVVVVDVTKALLGPLAFVNDRLGEFGEAINFAGPGGVLEMFAKGNKIVADSLDDLAHTFDTDGQKMSRAMLKAGETPQAIQDDLRESRAQMSVAASYGIKEPIVAATKGAMKDTRKSVQDGMSYIVDEIRGTRSALLSAASDAAEAMYRPIEARAELNRLDIEGKNAAKVINSSKSSAEERKDAQETLIQVHKSQMSLYAELYSYGKLTKGETASYMEALKKAYKSATGEAKTEIGQLIALLDKLMDKQDKASNFDYNGRGVGGRGGWGGHASGGFAKAGVPTWMGEHGKELWIPKTDGFVANDRDLTMAALTAGAGQPAEVGGGGVVVNAQFSFPSLVPYSPAEQEELARHIGPALIPYLRGRGFVVGA